MLSEAEANALKDSGNSSDVAAGNKIASFYKGNPATDSLSQYLATHAMAMVVGSRAINAAITRVGETEVGWSNLNDVWKALTNYYYPSIRCIFRCTPRFMDDSGHTIPPLLLFQADQVIQ